MWQEKQVSLQPEEAMMNPSVALATQLLATKLYMPVASGPLIARSRLSTLLTESLKHPLTLVSAPAGFGKTTALTTWVHSLRASQTLVAWLSLDEEDNDPQLFWTYVLAALDRQQPQRFSSLLQYLQSAQISSLKYIVVTLVNQLMENDQRFVLILDDYHLITESEVHAMLLYLIQHIPHQLHIIISTRADPPWPLAQLRTRRQVLEVRAPELCCTIEEAHAFFQVVAGVQLPAEMMEVVTTKTEGWLVGLKLLGFSLPGHVDPARLLEEISGDQHYILEYLTEEVLSQQPPDMQIFLLYTCILDQLTGSLCDAVTARTGSQQLLERLERANLFVTSLDNKRQWYCYHALFAEALRAQLEQKHADLVPVLHMRASHWYAERNQITQAVLHAFRAREWNWVAELIECHPLLSMTWGASKHEFAVFQKWFEQLPTEVVHARPQLCLGYTYLMWSSAPLPRLQNLLYIAEATLLASLAKQAPKDTPHSLLISQATQEQRDFLGDVFSIRAWLQSHQPDGEAALLLCQQALDLLATNNNMVRAVVSQTRAIVYYCSSLNDVEATAKEILQSVSLARAAGQSVLAIAFLSALLPCLIAAGQLREAHCMSYQIAEQREQSGGFVFPDVGWSAISRAEILREWNDLDAARSLAEEAISLCQQAESIVSIIFLLWGYAVLLRIYLSYGKLEAAHSVLQQFEHVGMYMNQFTYSYHNTVFATSNSVRLWLACGELDQATRWVEELDTREWPGTPLAREREEVACARVHLATAQPDLALQRLEPAFQRATAGKRWGHVIEIRLLQALAYQRSHDEQQALDALGEAVRLGEPEGYIRSFVDEGVAIATLLVKLREVQRKERPTPYLDRVLAAFPQPSQTPASPSKREAERTPVQSLQASLSGREREVLRLLAQGASNQEVAQELVIAVDTVKRHVSHIFAKLGVQNRVQAVKRACTLGLLDE